MNPLSDDALCVQIPELEERGVIVYSDRTCEDTNVPIGGMLALTLLTAACGLSGTLILRRRRS